MSFIPNTTPTPNWLYNGEMKKMNGTELKVVMLVTRKTLGWFDPMTDGRKTQDYISQSQFIEFTGQSNRAIATAIQVCVEHGWIIVRDRQGSLCDTPEKRRRRKNWYQLGSVFTNKLSKQSKQSKQQNGLDNSSEETSQDVNLVNKTTQPSEESSLDLVKKVHNTKETFKETITNIVRPEKNMGAFDQFWNAYPKKERKKDTRGIWSKKNYSAHLPEILKFIDSAKKTDRWKNGFIPQPSTFLNGERWTDDLSGYADKNKNNVSILKGNKNKYDKYDN